MGLAIAEARPPYVAFEARAEEDRAASLEAGHYVAKDVHYAIITPQGSKDRIERRVDEWLPMCAQQVQEERLPESWLKHYRALYDAWKADQAPPLNGTSIRDWSALSPAMVETLTRLRVLTVEDIAAANEETLARIGMGARLLKDRAIAWLEGTNSEVEKLKKANADLADKLSKAVASLETIAAMEEAKKASGQPSPKKL